MKKQATNVGFGKTKYDFLVTPQDFERLLFLSAERLMCFNHAKFGRLPRGRVQLVNCEGTRLHPDYSEFSLTVSRQTPRRMWWCVQIDGEWVRVNTVPVYAIADIGKLFQIAASSKPRTPPLFRYHAVCDFLFDWPTRNMHVVAPDMMRAIAVARRHAGGGAVKDIRVTELGRNSDWIGEKVVAEW